MKNDSPIIWCKNNHRRKNKFKKYVANLVLISLLVSSFQVIFAPGKTLASNSSGESGGSSSSSDEDDDDDEEEDCQLELLKTDSVDPVTIDQELVYHLTLTNIGEYNCTGEVLLRDELDSNTVYISSSLAPQTITSTYVEWSFFGIVSGESKSIYVTMDMAGSAVCDTVLQNTVKYQTSSSSWSIPVQENTQISTCPPDKGSIGDFVWIDENANGTFDMGELPLPGVVITLYDDADNLVANNITDSSGAYLFDTLDFGMYKVQVTTPSGYQITTSDIYTTTLSLSNKNYLDADFGFESLSVPPVAKGSIGDFAWIDENENGVFDMGEPPLASVLVTLYSGVNIELGNSVTDASGNYLFDNLVLDSYKVQVSTPAGYDLTTPMLYTTTLTLANKDYLDADFGFNLTPVLPNQGSIGDYVWIDTNGNGVIDAGELPLENVVVTLTDTFDVVLATATTDMNGAYLFNNLDFGDYKVTATTPAGFSLTTTTQYLPILSSASKDYLDADFGFQIILTEEVGSVGDYVWIDANGDGVIDTGELPMENVVVTLLDGASAVISTTTTDVNGSYLFAGLNFDTYKVQATTPFGYSMTTTTLYSTTITSVNKDYLDADFGFKPVPSSANTGSIGDYTWIDINANSTVDNGEVAIKDVIVKLYDSSDVEIASTITDASGSYIFNNLVFGDYRVATIAPGGYSTTTSDSFAVTLSATTTDFLAIDFGFKPIVTGCVSNCGGGGGGGVIAYPVLHLEKTVDKSFVHPGDELNYTIKVTNINNKVGTGLSLVDDLPAGLRYSDQSENQKTWDLGNIQPRESKTMTYLVIVEDNAAGGIYKNIAIAKITNGSSPHNEASANAVVEVSSTLVVDEPILTITKTSNMDFINPNTEVEYTLIVKNDGSTVAYNAVLTDPLPDGFTQVDTGKKLLVWELGNLNPGDEKTFIFNLFADESTSGYYDNIASVRADNFPDLFAEDTIEVRNLQVLGVELLPDASGPLMQAINRSIHYLFICALLFLLYINNRKPKKLEKVSVDFLSGKKLFK